MIFPKETLNHHISTVDEDLLTRIQGFVSTSGHKCFWLKFMTS